MRICPKCHTKYIDEEKTCHDCGIQLIPYRKTDKESYGVLSSIGKLFGIRRKQYIKEAERENWAEFEYIDDEISGVMIKGILENNGISVVIEDARFLNLTNVKNSINYKGVILVPKEDLEKARKIISEYLQATNEDD